MAIDINGDRIFKFIQNRWEYKSTIIILILIVVIIGIWKFTGSKLNDLSTKEILFILTSALTLLIIWWRSTIIPKAKKSTVGFALAIDCETPEVEKSIKPDFIETIKRLINQGALERKFSVIEISQNISKRIHDNFDARKIREKARCHFIVYGTAKIREIDGSKKYILNLAIQVAHKPIPKAKSQQISKEMAEIFPGRLMIEKDNDYLTLEFTSEWIDCVSKYIIGIAATISGDHIYAESLFLSVHQNRHIQQSSLPQLKKIRGRLKVWLGEIYNYRASVVYEQWRNDRLPEQLKEMWSHLVQLRRFDPHNYSSRLLISIYLFVSQRDINGAIQELRKCRDIRDATWRYNYAFLLAYNGNLKKARKMYNTAFRQYCVRLDVPIQTEEFLLWIIQEEPDRIQLYFCLGLINWHAKQDIKQAIDDFRKFLESAGADQFPEEVRLAEAYIKTLEGRIKKQQSE